MRGLSFAIPRGEVFGFSGPNGAGKTSTIKVLATLLKPASGRALVAGLDVVRDAHAVRRKIGYMPDFFGVYDDLTEKHEAPVDGLSRGMKQRLGLARSASKKHAVILNGVSPRAQAGAKRSEEPLTLNGRRRWE